MSQQAQIEPSIPTIDEIGISRESLTALSRPISPLPIVKRDAGESLDGWLLRLPDAEETQVIANSFEPHSWGSPLPTVQAIMYQLLVETKSSSILEIGTLFGGSTHVLARAAHAMGNNGVVVTIDPFGGHRVPAILRELPGSLSELVHFFPYSSMELFLQNQNAQMEFDAVFIDGDHNHEGALFDVFSAAQCLKPNGVIVMDNTNDYGVTLAALEFIRHFPNWQVLGVDGKDVERGFDLDGGLLQSVSTEALETAQLYLVRPSGKSLGTFPLKFRAEVPSSYEGKDELLLHLVTPSVAGRLIFRGHFNAVHLEFHKTGTAGEHQSRGGSHSVESGLTCIRISIDPVCFDIDRSAHYFDHTLEFQFIADDAGKALELDGEPEFRLSTQA